MPTEMLYQHSLAATVREFAAKGMRRLLVTSTVPGEGRSSVLAGLARTLAESGTESVVSVDADSLHPGLHRAFGLCADRSLRDLLDRVYLFDITQEDPVQFGLGDWLEILRAQVKTGELRVVEGDEGFSIHFFKGSIRSISEPDAGEETCLGGVLVRRGAITSRERDDFLKIQQQSGRPLGDVARTLGSVGEDVLIDALRDQASRRLTKLAALRRPVCRFFEVAESYLPATGGRAPAPTEGLGIDDFVDARLRDYLKDPFLSSQLPVYLTDSELPNLKLLAGGGRPFDLLAPRFARAFGLMLDRLARIFDIVLLNGPPISLTSPTAMLAGLADGVLLVVKADGPDVRSIRRTVEELRRAGGKVLGVVLNQAEVRGGVAPAVPTEPAAMPGD